MMRYAKALVPLVVTVLAGAITQGLLVGHTAAWITVIIGAVTSAGVYQIPNKPRPTDGTPTV